MHGKVAVQTNEFFFCLFLHHRELQKLETYTDLLPKVTGNLTLKPMTKLL